MKQLRVLSMVLIGKNHAEEAHKCIQRPLKVFS